VAHRREVREAARGAVHLVCGLTLSKKDCRAAGVRRVESRLGSATRSPSAAHSRPRVELGHASAVAGGSSFPPASWAASAITPPLLTAYLRLPPPDPSTLTVKRARRVVNGLGGSGGLVGSTSGRRRERTREAKRPLGGPEGEHGEWC
jgi:hypothetical protein